MIDRIATVNKQSYRNKVNKSMNAMFTSVFVPDSPLPRYAFIGFHFPTQYYTNTSSKVMSCKSF